MQLRLLFVFFSSFAFLTPCLFGTDPSEDVQKKAGYVLRGFDDTIMRINSGVCRIVGKTIEPHGNVINDDILIAFDYGTHYYRFDNGNLKRTLLTPEFYYEVWNLHTLPLSVTRSPAANPEISGIHCRLVDIQSIYHWAPIGSCKPYDYQQSQFHQQNEEVRITGYEELPNGLVKITREIPQPPTAPKVYDEYIINTNEGYTVQQIKMNFGYTYETSWKNINQTWVPVAYVFKSGSNSRNFGAEWKIDWEQVNEKVDPRYFDLEEMLADQEEGAFMLSDELGTGTVIIGKVGKGYAPIPETSLPTNYPLFNYILMGLGIFLIILGLGKKIYDYVRSRSRK